MHIYKSVDVDRGDGKGESSLTVDGSTMKLPELRNKWFSSL